MTNNEAISIVQRTMFAEVVDLIMKDDREMAQHIDDAWKIVREAALKGTCKTENRPSDKGTTTAWMNMPESPNDAFMRNTDESLNELNHRTMQCETEIDMLWNEVERLKERMPREWK